MSSMENGLHTPASLTDTEDVQMEDVEEETNEEQELPKMTRGRKRKVMSEVDSPFEASVAVQSSDDKTYVLESVTVPARRSKLGQVKTESKDNLTLGSPASKRVGRSSGGVIKSDPAEESDVDELDLLQSSGQSVASRDKVKVKAEPPFNIGKYSRVSKASPSSLALEEKPAPARGRGKGKGTLSVKTEDESSVKEYALDTDEEEEQYHKAIEASMDMTPETSTASSSRASSLSASKARGKAKGKSNIPLQRLKRAVTNSAKKRQQLDSASIDPSRTASPSSDDASSFALSDSEDQATDAATTSALSDDSAAEDAYEDAPLRKSKKKPLKRTTSKVQTKKTQSANKQSGSALEDSDEAQDLSDDEQPDWMDQGGYDDREDEAEWKQRMRDLNAIREEEAELKRKVGRKLTNGERNYIRLCRHHEELVNVWGDLQANIVPVKPVTMEAHPSLKLTLLPFQKESLYWMKKQEEGPWKGGMLADEMGMGKTIQTIALLLSEPRRKPSLVVAPVVALMQWKHEIETHAEGFTVCLWHGSGRMKANELKKYDVVLVSYGTLEASFRRQQRGFKKNNILIKEKSPMHEFQWYRVILDEAHNIKERSTNAAKAAFALDAKYRWCLSGTPLQNRVGELYSLVRFLGAQPFSSYFCKRCDCKSLHWQFSDRRHCDQCHHKPMDHVCFWNTEILTPIARYGIEAGNPGHTAFKKLKILLDRMMLRRTKLERADDLGLPPRTIVVRRDFFSPAEKELYSSLFSNARRQFSTYIDAGTVLNNYSNIFSLITRMRQMACHPDLVLRSKTSKVNDVSEGTVCRICNDAAEDAIMSSCKHVFDRECIRQYLEVQQLRGHRPECPVCHIEISIDLEAEALDLTEDNKKARQGILSRLNLDNWRSSSKLEALVEELEKLRNQDCTIKSLVFSQFVSFLDLIAFRLQRAGFNICRLEGGMTPQQRDATIQHFMKNTHVTVFLISLKAGGVALNLTEASMVFMMDSWWNPSVEYQAMDRIHRLGQRRPVKVVKLVVEDSIEHQIVELQHKKLAMTEAALSTDPDAALGKLTVEDLGFLFKM